MSKGLNYIIVPQLAKLVVWFDDYKNAIEGRKLK